MGLSLSVEKDINDIFCKRHRKVMEHHQIFLEFLVMSAEEQRVQDHYHVAIRNSQVCSEVEFHHARIKIATFFGIFQQKLTLCNS